MPAQMTAELPVLSQRVDPRSATYSNYFADLCLLCLQRIHPQEWIVTDAKRGSAPLIVDPFAAVAHDYRVTNRPAILREDDSATKPIVAIATAERYHGSRGRLLAFKKAR
jgi:hypothetical protein